MLRRIIVLLAISLLSLSVFLPTPVVAEVWLEVNEDHDGFEWPHSFHVHARVGANAYLYGNDCQYKDWVHTVGDTSVPSPLVYVQTDDHDNQEGWTKTAIQDGTYEIDFELANLIDLEDCPV